MKKNLGLFIIMLSITACSASIGTNPPATTSTTYTTPVVKSTTYAAPAASTTVTSTY